ncbi:MAG: transposase [Thermotogae bacterium]|nr:transposase [Thermotogota bacterium]
MKVSKFSVEKIIQILTEAKVTSVSEVCRKYQISSSTYYKWVQKFSGFSTNDAKRLLLLESENSELKKLLAEKELEINALREFVKKNNL